MENRPQNRSEDITKRGMNHLVIDYGGRIVKLEEAMVLFNEKREYIPPPSAERKGLNFANWRFP